MRGGMAFTQAVPKLIQQMLSSNPGVKLQGQAIRASGDDEGAVSGFDAMARSMLVDAAMARSQQGGAGKPTRPDNERERPERDDEAPMVANLDDYAGHADLDTLLPALARKREKEEEEAAAKASADHATAGSASAAAASTSAAPAASSSAPVTGLSLSDARLLHVKRARAADSDADAIERQTGKHVFRKAVGGSALAAAGAEADATLSEEERARKRRKKKEEAEKAKSKLTFDENDF